MEYIMRIKFNKRQLDQTIDTLITFYVQQQDDAKTPASQFQLCQKGGAVLAERTENVPFVVGMDEILYRFKFGISIGSADIT